jgi:hypothetical protein
MYEQATMPQVSSILHKYLQIILLELVFFVIHEKNYCLLCAIKYKPQERCTLSVYSWTVSMDAEIPGYSVILQTDSGYSGPLHNIQDVPYYSRLFHVIPDLSKTIFVAPCYSRLLHFTRGCSKILQMKDIPDC